ncbi:MAG: helix-turn-helix domain-containing protein [Actinomycetota bacterium]|nr:helix-turn-helix domain-containing protein [Actinomycetota bacterium]
MTLLDEVNTEADLASFLKEHPDTVRARRINGTGPRYVRIGRSIRYRRDDVLAWLEVNTVTGTGAI